jgi:putative transposase
MLSRRRNKPAATKFFARMLEINESPTEIVIDKRGANTTGIKAINKLLKRFSCPTPIEMVRRKYLINIVEQDHRFIKRRTRPMLGFKAFTSAAAKIDGTKVVHLIG